MGGVWNGIYLVDIYSRHIAHVCGCVYGYVDVGIFIIWIQYQCIAQSAEEVMNNVSFSKKDGQYIQQCFKQTIQNYYQNPCPQTLTQILCLNTLITESITSQPQLDSSQIIPKLQTLKIKSKNNEQLKNSIIATVAHLRSPRNLDIRVQTLVGCLQLDALYGLTCVVVNRLARGKFRAVLRQAGEDVVRGMFGGMGGSKGAHVGLMIDALVQIINVCGELGKESKIVEIASYLIDNQLKQATKDKSSTQKSLKIILSACKLCPSLTHTKQPILSPLLYSQKASIFQIHDLLTLTYNPEYLNPLLQSITKSSIDFLYLWSFSSAFCLEIQQEHVQALLGVMADEGITAEDEGKIYVMVNNFLGGNQLEVGVGWGLPRFMGDQRVMAAYLGLVATMISHQHGVVPVGFDIVAIQKKCVENKIDSQAIKKLIKNVKDCLNSSHSHSNSGGMRQSKKVNNQTVVPAGDHSLELLLPKATKIPKNDEDLKNIHEVLIYTFKNLDETERENLRSLKNRALQSLKISLLKSQNLYFQKIFNFLDLKQYDPETLKKLLQIANMQLKLNPKSASVINVYHLASIILQIDGKDHDLLDFQQLSQIFYMCLGSEEWNREGFQRGKEEWRVYLLGKIRELKLSQKKKVARIDSIQDIVDLIGNLKINQQLVQKKQEQIQPKKVEESPVQKKTQEKKQIEVKPVTSPVSVKEEKVIEVPKPRSEQQQFVLPEQKKSQMTEELEEYSLQVIENRQEKAQQQQVIQKISQIKITQTPVNPQPKPQQKPKQKPLQPQPKPEPPATQLPLKQKLALNIILKYKIKDMVKKWIKRAKKSKQRFYKLREWSETEKTYLEKLLVLRDQIQNPLIKCGFINDLEASHIFPNLDSMIRLCEEMCVSIEELYKNFNPLTTQLAPTLKSVTNFLKIYKNYSQNYNNSYQKIKTLQLSPQFRTHVKVPNLQNYLFSPVQRFQKYHLFVSQYLRNLPKEHRDTAPLQIELNCLLKVTDQINQFIENQLRAKKMVEMEKKFGNVVSNARQFRTEFVANTLDSKCKVYVFNDLLIVARITPENREELYMRIKLCGKSVVIRQPDCLSFKNRLYICGIDMSIHLTFETLNEVQAADKFIRDLLETMYQNQYKRLDLISQAQSRIKQGSTRMSKIENQTPTMEITSKYNRLELSAEVVGMEKMYYHGVLQTYFVIKLNFSRPYQIYQVIFCELGVLQDIQHNLRQTNPTIKIPTIQIKSKQAIADDLTKVSEHLCVVVQKFLNYILRNKNLMKKPELTLLKLGLHQILWIFLNTDRQNTQCSCQQCLHAEIFQDMGFYRKQRNIILSRRFKFCVLNSFNTQNTIKALMRKQMFEDLGVEQRLIWANCQLRRIDYRLQLPLSLGKKLPFKVHIQMLSDPITIQIKSATIYTNCRQIIEQICHRLGIETTLDLALVFVQDENQLILDDDQILWNYVKIVQEAEDQMKKMENSGGSGRFSIFQRLSWGTQGDGKKVKKMSLCMRKVVTLSHAIEQRQCQKNHERYNFIVGEIIRKVKSQIILVNLQDLQFLCAIVFCIQHFSRLVVQKKFEINPEKLKKCIPEFKWSLITPNFISKVTHMVESQISVADKIAVLHRSALKYFWPKYAFQYFSVQNTEPSTLLGNHKSLQIGICYKKVSVSRKQTNASLLQYPVSRLNYRIYADSLYIETEQKTHCFKGNNLFILDLLVQKYKTLHDFENS